MSRIEKYLLSYTPKTQWTMKIADCPWTEDTTAEVEFVINYLSLIGNERILDIGCGYGRHSLMLAEKGFNVVGVDTIPEYINAAKAQAFSKGLKASFYCSNILDLQFHEDFDVVINLCDGAIGYFNSDRENERLFKTISDALIHGGKHLLQILNREHAEKYFPRKDWDFGKKAISLVEFNWEPERHRMIYTEKLAYWGQTLDDPEDVLQASIKLYSLSEITSILNSVGMQVVSKSSSLVKDIEFNGDELILVLNSVKK